MQGPFRISGDRDGSSLVRPCVCFSAHEAAVQQGLMPSRRLIQDLCKTDRSVSYKVPVSPRIFTDCLGQAGA